MKKNNFKKFWKLGRKEVNTQYFDITKDGDLIIIEGNYQYNVRELVEKFGTPLKVMFPCIIEQRVEDMMDMFADVTREYKYRGQFYYHYPMKVNQSREFVLPLISEGANLETTSANELWVVKRMWQQNRFNSRIKVICNGPKTKEYVDLIAELKDNGLDIVPIIEDLEEVEILKNFRGQVGVRFDNDLRVESHWDKQVERFGLNLEELYSLGKIKNLTMLHYHLGCEVKRERYFVQSLKKAMDVYVKLKKVNPSLDTINIGGGFRANYYHNPRGGYNYSMPSVVRGMIKFLVKFCAENDIPQPNIINEWGSYIAAPAQITVYSVLSSKLIPKSTAKQWYVINGSLQTHLLDTWAIHKQWHIVPVNNARATKLTRTWLAGLSCDADDKYTASGSYILLPRLEDLESGEKQHIAVLDTGNYQDGFLNHHCLNAAPAKVVCQDGDVKLVRKRETPEDIGKMFGW